MRIKIVQKGWAGFSGSMGTMVFKDGIAETTPVEARRIGALVQVVECDENGFEFEPVSDAHTMVVTRNLSATVQDAMKSGEDDPPAPADDATTDAEIDADPVDAPAAPPVPVAPEYDRAKLEAVGSAEGIKGIREIAEKFGVRGTSISGLIEAILTAQQVKAKG